MGIGAAFLLVIGAAVARDSLVADDQARDGVVTSDHGAVFPVGSIDRPTPTDGADAPLGTPPEVVADGSWSPLSTDAHGRPVRWDPCRPVHWALNDESAPDGVAGLVEEAVAEVARATGLRLELDGRTEEVWSEARPAVQRDLYGDRWAPVLVIWSDAAGVPALAGAVAGVGGPVTVEAPGGQPVYVSGVAVLDGPDMAASLASSGPDEVVAVVVHELAHVLGLGHVGDPDALMAPARQVGAGGLQDGDRAGLAEMGRGPCVDGV